MDFESFIRSVETEEEPSEKLSLELRALWWDRKGDWGKAHDLCQEARSSAGDWVHAYLHRVEGDEGNASYWYNRCDRAFFYGNTSDEWEAIARELLAVEVS